MIISVLQMKEYCKKHVKELEKLKISRNFVDVYLAEYAMIKIENWMLEAKEGIIRDREF